MTQHRPMLPNSRKVLNKIKSLYCSRLAIHDNSEDKATLAISKDHSSQCYQASVPALNLVVVGESESCGHIQRRHL